MSIPDFRNSPTFGICMIVRSLTLILLSCLGDLSLWAYFQVPLPFFSRALWYGLVSNQAPLEILIFSCAAATFPGFLLADSVGIDLCMILGLGSVMYYIHSLVNIPFGIRVSVICTALLIQSVLLEAFLANVVLGRIQLVCAFISATTVVYLLTGSQGNRSLW